MPPKKAKATKKKTARLSEDEDGLMPDSLDVQYNPDVVNGLISELALLLEAKCEQIQKDSDFLEASIEQDFRLEMIKIPKQVKEMSIKKFKEEYGFSIEAVARGGMAKTQARGNYSIGGQDRRNPVAMNAFKTPAHSKYSSAATPRNPKEGERLLSENGSPLGEFQTVKKAPRNKGQDVVPPTPGVFVPLKNGDIIDIENDEIENMSAENKEEALLKMQEVMANMQKMMARLQPQAV